MTTKVGLEDLKDAVKAASAAGATTQSATNTDSAEPVSPKIDAQGRSYATGKRKNAIARVWISFYNSSLSYSLYKI